MEWEIQKNKSNRIDAPCITLRKKAIALNVPFMEQSGYGIGDFASVFVSKCGHHVAVKFFSEDGEDRYLLTPDGGGNARTGGKKTVNAVIATSCLANHPRTSILVGTINGKIVMRRDGDMWVGNLSPTWQHKLSERKPNRDEIGVYQYLFDGEIVYIGQGHIAERLSESSRSSWAFDEIEYMIVDKDTAIKEEQKLIESHRAEFGKLPFYNKVSGISPK